MPGWSKIPSAEPDLDPLDEESTATLSEVTASLERLSLVPRVEPRGTLSRYALGEQLGSGSSGTVYRAVDTERDLPVALKVLHRFGPLSLARFKAEFRVASRCSDPCLLSMFELVEEDGIWGIAMELVDGPGFIRHVRPSTEGGAVDERRLRTALRGIFQGLSALHAGGILHRDIKPSNVLLDRAGEVRIADFGLAKLFEADAGSMSQGMVVGTPAYMAPESCRGLPLTPAGDLYSVGVVLYEALTGERPFHGNTFDVLRKKTLRAAPDPATRAPAAPADLLALARKLLARNPAERPTLSEAQAVVAERSSLPSTPRRPSPPFVGREAEIAQVFQAFDSADDRAILVRVVGPSGVGKSAVLRTLARVLQQSRGATVLSGRCHELESIPHKGFDSIVDALRQVLASWEQARLANALPPSTVDVLPMFPVLGDILPFGKLASGLEDNERMRRAREAVVTLLRAVSSSSPLVLVLDDAQWGDAAGAGLLDAVLAARPACVRMVLVAYRASEAAESPFLKHIASMSGVGRPPELTLELGPLRSTEAEALARYLVSSDDDLATRIAQESRGEPFLLEQLALAGAEDRTFQGSIDDVVLHRARTHGDEAFRLLEVAAIAGAPLPERLLTEVAETRDARRTIHELVVASLLRRSGSGPEAALYPYHDRIRTGIESSVGPERKRALHARIAQLGESTGTLGAAALVRHFELAGDRAHAALHAQRAALDAERALAFGTAATMYGRLLELSSDETQRQEARCARARTLYIAGQSDEAGAAFALAAQHASAPAADDLQRQAVEAYLAFGHIAEALALLVPILEREGMPYPRTPRAILVSFVATILSIRRRTLLPPRIRQEPDEALGGRADLAWTGKGLCNVAPQQGVILTLTSLSLALRSGDAFRIARGLSFAGCGFTPGLVGPGRRYLGWLHEMAESLDDNRLRVLHSIALGGQSLMTGEWARCVSACEEAITIAEKTPAPTHWEQTIARTFECTAYEFMGQFRQMASSSSACLRVVRGRGDRIGEVMIGSGLGYALAAHHDRPALTEVIEEMKRLMGEWTVPVPFWEAFLLRLECLRALCWGDTQESLALLDARWSMLREHRLLDLPMVRYPLTSIRASVLLEATARGLLSRERSVSAVRRCISVLSRAPRAEGPAAAEIARAALAHLEGRAARRDVHLLRAIDIARAGRMRAVELMASRALAAHRSAAPDITRIDAELLSLGVGSPGAWGRAVTPALGAA